MCPTSCACCDLKNVCWWFLLPGTFSLSIPGAAGLSLHVLPRGLAYLSANIATHTWPPRLSYFLCGTHGCLGWSLHFRHDLPRVSIGVPAPNKTAFALDTGHKFRGFHYPLRINNSLQWLKELRNTLYLWLDFYYKGYKSGRTEWKDANGEAWKGVRLRRGAPVSCPRGVKTCHPPSTSVCVQSFFEWAFSSFCSLEIRLMSRGSKPQPSNPKAGLSGRASPHLVCIGGPLRITSLVWIEVWTRGLLWITETLQSLRKFQGSSSSMPGPWDKDQIHHVLYNHLCPFLICIITAFSPNSRWALGERSISELQGQCLPHWGTHTWAH